MKIGYPCINRTITCRGNKTFRLKSYSESRLIVTVGDNLDCLLAILRFNLINGIFFFRISSDIVPFASHPVCTFNWQKYFAHKLSAAGRFAMDNGMRISMHPDQFTIINSIDSEIFLRSRRELEYHAQLLDLMGLDNTARIQVHVGGVYGDKRGAMERFAERFTELDERVRRRLVVENDDRSFNVKDCLLLHQKTGIPVLFDVFHDSLNPSGLSLSEILPEVAGTWKQSDGLPMFDYSSQKRGARAGQHAEHIDIGEFLAFIGASKGFDFDIMLEIKDKEKSTLKALRALSDKPGVFL